MPGEEVAGDNRRFTDAPLMILDSEPSDHLEDVQHAVHIGCAKIGTFSTQLEIPPDRIVCIGGMLEVVQLVNRFTSPNSPRVPVFSIPSTGGAATRFENRADIQNPEQRVAETIQSRLNVMRFEPPADIVPNAPTPRGLGHDWEG